MLYFEGISRDQGQLDIKNITINDLDLGLGNDEYENSFINISNIREVNIDNMEISKIQISYNLLYFFTIESVSITNLYINEYKG